MKNVNTIYTAILLLFTFSSAARAIPENRFQELFASRVLTEVNQNLKLSEISPSKNVSLNVGLWPISSKRGTVIIVPGRTECIGTFRELIYDLHTRGYSVAILDHRGQGHSSRVEKTIDVGHVENFQDYVSDFSFFMEKEVYGKMPQPYFIIADSMGAAISTLYLANHPGAIQAVSFAAPMYMLKTTPFPETIASLLARFLKYIGRGASYAPTTKSYNFEQKFEDNNFTHSRIRFTTDLERIRNDPTAAVGGPSVNWIHESLEVSKKVPSIAESFKFPVLLFEAGIDHFVTNEAQKNFCAKAPNCKLVTFPSSFHSMLIETDEVRDAILEQSDLFFQSAVKMK